MKILVTGFGPFPGVPHNISGEVAEACAEAWSGRPGVTAEFLLLDTDWQTAPSLVRQKLKQTEPDIIIHLGVADDATGLTLESHAYNACCGSPDVCGYEPKDVALHRDGPAQHTTTVPLGKIAGQLRSQGLNFAISNDPGRYLCNAVYHEGLATHAAGAAAGRCVFIHLPVHPASETISLGDIRKSLDIVLDTMIAG
ncbi:MAG: hypothetical protein ACR2O4_15760 [Hyphomicrobiaceae bacterium]